MGNIEKNDPKICLLEYYFLIFDEANNLQKKTPLMGPFIVSLNQVFPCFHFFQ